MSGSHNRQPVGFTNTLAKRPDVPIAKYRVGTHVGAFVGLRRVRRRILIRLHSFQPPSRRASPTPWRNDLTYQQPERLRQQSLTRQILATPSQNGLTHRQPDVLTSSDSSAHSSTPSLFQAAEPSSLANTLAKRPNVSAAGTSSPQSPTRQILASPSQNGLAHQQPDVLKADAGTDGATIA